MLQHCLLPPRNCTAAFRHMMYSILPFQRKLQQIIDIIRGHGRVQNVLHRDPSRAADALSEPAFSSHMSQQHVKLCLSGDWADSMAAWHCENPALCTLLGFCGVPALNGCER